MPAAEGVADNRTPLCFPEPEPVIVTLTGFLRVQPQLTEPQARLPGSAFKGSRLTHIGNANGNGLG